VNAVRIKTSQDRSVGRCSNKNLLDKRVRHDDNIKPAISHLLELLFLYCKASLGF
jgi:hypothetical protein